jgi:glutamate-ammonia-ligase adenylyltransferase
MRFPASTDTASAARLMEAFPGARTDAIASLLACLGGNSPYLTDLALREPDAVRAILTHGPDAVCDLALGTLTGVQPTLPRPALAALLRTAKRRVALAAAVADIGGAWTLAQVTGALSDLAEGALRLVADHLLRAAHDRGELRLPHPAAPSRNAGFTVLAMGKLGARELNFSSDVDLILIYDPEAHAYNADALGAIFSRLTRDLVSLMQQRDAGGYVFRTDLRLRPDPASTPPAVSLSAALAYYEGTAQTWERAAMIKARPVAGDLALGRRFLDAIRPFVWRRHLDFAAIADIRAMKRRMDEHKGAALSPTGPPATRLLGHDLKLGQGGIREIEFCAQMLQLVWGGRNPGLRSPATLDALRALADSGHLPADTVATLFDAYDVLRRTEHRLQMVDDRQTHRLPESADGLKRFANFMGFASADAFASSLLVHLDAVYTAFAGLLEQQAAPPDTDDNALLDDFTPPGEHEAPWRAWLEGRPAALRTERARALLRQLLPALHAAVRHQAQPDVVWGRLDAFIHRLPQGVQLFSMLQHNPALLERLVDVLGAAPSLADHLAAVPAALEGLMSPQDIDRSAAFSLTAQLGDARALDEALGIASRFVRGEEFRLAVAELDGRIDQDAAGDARTALAEAAISALLPLVLRDHARRYGRLSGGGLAVVALGKAGSREMMAGSDLDLLLIYDHPGDATQSTGPARLAPSQYFARAAQAITAALTVPTRDGKLYDVDMRLRPSGNKGPVAVSLSAFERYHHESAWTWERLALTRARVIAGPARLRSRVTRAIKTAMAQGDPALILPDTVAMRRRQLADLPPSGPWDAKRRRGGLMEVEFVAQALQLRLAATQPRVLSPITRVALHRLARAGVLPPAEAGRLIQADAAWRAIQGLLRITLGRSVPATLPEVTEARLHAAVDHVLGPAPGIPLADRVEAVAHEVSAAFQRHVGEI